MIESFLKRLWQMAVLVALQVFVFNHIHLFGYATPMVYVLFLVHMPLCDMAVKATVHLHGALNVDLVAHL